MKKLVNVILFSVVLGMVLTAPASAATIFPQEGLVQADNLRIRTSASRTGQVLGQVDRNTPVSILKEEGEWFEIEYPAGKFVYIASKYVDVSKANGATEGKTTGTKLNVRLTPDDEKGIIVGTLHAGTPVEIVGEKNGYYTVVAPAGITAWVYAAYVMKAGELRADGKWAAAKNGAVAAARKSYKPYASYVASIAKAKAEEERKAALARAAQMEFERLEREFRSINGKAWDRQDWTVLKSQMRSFVQTAGDASLTQQISLRLISIEVIEQRNKRNEEKAQAEQKPGVDQPQVSVEPPVKPVADTMAITKAETPKEETTQVEAPEKTPTDGLKPGQCVVTGKLDALGPIFNRPATHELVRGTKTIYHLRWDAGDLNRYWRKNVRIVGTKVRFAGWEETVIIVDRIEVIE